MTKNIENKFKQSLNIIRDENRQAYISYVIGNGLYESVDEYIDEMNNSHVFFINTIHSHFYTSTMSICKVFDKRNDIHITKLINMAIQNKNIFTASIDDEVVANQLTWIKGLNKKIDKLMETRDKYLAHIDKIQLKQSVEEILKQLPITRTEMAEIIDGVDEILLYYKNCFYNEDIGSIIREDEDDYKKVLEAIRYKLKS